jgi:hypothetical protein
MRWEAVKNYRDLIAWQKAFELTLAIYAGFLAA